MQFSKLFKQSFVYATATVAYVMLVVLLMNNASRLFGQVDNMITGVSVLLLFVFSAALTGSLVFGKPVLMYVEGLKKEAIKTLAGIIIWLFIWLMIFLGLALVIRGF